VREEQREKQREREREKGSHSRRAGYASDIWERRNTARSHAKLEERIKEYLARRNGDHDNLVENWQQKEKTGKKGGKGFD